MLKERGIVVYITASNREEAEKISEILVNEKLAACAGMADGLRSVFRWKGEICREDEVLIIAKTSGKLFVALAERVRQIHSYDVPEIIGLPIVYGDADYLKWLENETQ